MDRNEENLQAPFNKEEVEQRLKEYSEKQLELFKKSEASKSEMDFTNSISEKKQKKINKKLIEFSIRENKKQKKGLVNLYLILKSRYDSELGTYLELGDKIEFLQKLMDKITVRINKAKRYNNLTENQEEHEDHLLGLHRVLEHKIHSFFNDIKPVENKYPLIFKDDRSFSLFLRLHKIYESSQTNLADYSFIYYYMQKDGLIITKKGSDFIKFLGKEFDIHIDKIDSRQIIGTESRTTLYNILKRQ